MKVKDILVFFLAFGCMLFMGYQRSITSGLSIANTDRID